MTFEPKWASAPGDTIRDLLAQRDWTPEQLSNASGLDWDVVAGVLSGSTYIDLRTARALADSLGSSASFWMTRDLQYHDDLKWLEASTWAEGLPTAQMQEFGWIASQPSWRGQVGALFDFFAIEGTAEWSAEYAPRIKQARLRASSSTQLNVGALAAWLRQGEILAQAIPLDPWDRGKFLRALEAARAMTKKGDPESFMPALTKLFATTGVAVVVVRAPEGCPVSGAARMLSSTAGLIQLSARYLSDDQFWFTFFHEAGHLAEHAEAGLFLDDQAELVDQVSDFEREANEFARRAILGGRQLPELTRIRTKDVVRAASYIGVAPGLVVGQLQHDGTLGHEQLNGLKRRYRWNGVNLESKRT